MEGITSERLIGLRVLHTFDAVWPWSVSTTRAGIPVFSRTLRRQVLGYGTT
jgi:hypothetical protein